MSFDRQLDHNFVHWRSHISDNGAEMRYVMLASVESGGYGSIEVQGIIALREDEGTRWTGSIAGEGFNFDSARSPLRKRGQCL